MACAAKSRLSELLFSGAEYCKARKRLLVTLFDEEKYLPRKEQTTQNLRFFGSYFHFSVFFVFRGTY